MCTKIIHIDMDGVLCDYDARYREFRENKPEIEFPQSQIGFFLNLVPIKDAIESVNRLRSIDQYDVYILTAPSVRNAHSYSEKRQWIEKYFGFEFARKLIISGNKGLLKGDVLIDDNVSGKGQEHFTGSLITFGSLAFPDWSAVLAELDSLFE